MKHNREVAQLRPDMSELRILQSTIDALTTAVAIIDTNGEILLANRIWMESVKSIFSGLQDSSARLNYLGICDKASGPEANAAFSIARAIRSVTEGRNESCEIEYSWQTSDHPRWFTCRVATCSESPKRLIVIHEDISDRKLLEEDAVASKSWPQALVDGSPNCIYITDSKGRYVFANKALVDLYGIEKSQIIGKDNSELSCNYLTKNKAHSELMVETDKANNHRNTSLEVNASFVLPDRAVRWYSIITKPLPLPGVADAVLTIAIDLTTLCKAQDEIRNSELRLQATLDAQASRVVLLDSNRHVLWPNDKACKSAGLSRQKVIGRKCNQVWGGQLADCESCPVEEALRTGKSSSIQKTTINGHIWRIHGFPVRDDMGRVVSAVEVVEDITKYVSLEGQLRQAQKMESLGTLAGGIAHDFNNILTGILGYTELAQERAKGLDPLPEYLHEVYSAGLRATELTRQILTFSRRTNIELFPLQIKPVVEEAIKLLRPTLPTTIEFNIHLEPNLKQILADPTQIHQIIINLCTNASHAMEPYGGVLGIELVQVELDSGSIEQMHSLRPGKYLKLSISDTGCGMSPEIVSSVFDPYFTTKDLGEGTGLGLSVVHGIVNEYGGDIQIDSTPGEGTTFTLFFPIVDKSTADSAAAIQEYLPTGTERILIVDDEPIILKLCTRILSKQGYQVIGETDSLKALASFKENPHAFDLVITDVTMPKMTGDVLATKILALRPEIPVILCTGYSRVVSEESVKKIGAHSLLIKPVVKQLMISEVRKALDNEVG